jgi:phage terminase small subunit
MTRRAAPKHLREPTKAWWRSVIARYDLEEHEERLLTLAGEAFDRTTEAREALEREGTHYIDRFGAPRSHPAVALERDSRLSFAKLVRQLQLKGHEAPGVEDDLFPSWLTDQ